MSFRFFQQILENLELDENEFHNVFHYGENIFNLFKVIKYNSPLNFMLILISNLFNIKDYVNILDSGCLPNFESLAQVIFIKIMQLYLLYIK